MHPEERGLFARAIGLITGASAIATVLVLSSVAGESAYLAFQPSALEAQAISAANAPVNATTESGACQQEIAAAAARGTPDTESVITDQSSPEFEDHCVAAVLSPSAASLGPNNPGSYMCVGKSATVNVGAGGVISETAVPDAAVPAGTCAAIACGAPGVSGQSSCFAAENLTTLNGNTVQETLTTAENTSVTSDQGITSFTMNPDGSIASSNGNSSGILDSSAGEQNLGGNAVSLNQSAGAGMQTSALNTPPGEPPSMGETQAVSAEPAETPSDLSSPANTPPVANQGTQPSASVSSDASAPGTGETGVTQQAEAPVTTTASAGTQPPVATQPTLTQGSPTATGVQPTTPTLNANAQLAQLPSSANPTTPTVDLSSANTASSESWFSKVGSTITNDGITALNDVRGWFGFGPIDMAPAQTTPVMMGIRG